MTGHVSAGHHTDTARHWAPERIKSSAFLRHTPDSPRDRESRCRSYPAGGPEPRGPEPRGAEPRRPGRGVEWETEQRPRPCTRYGCFLPDLTGLARGLPAADLPPHYIRCRPRRRKFRGCHRPGNRRPVIVSRRSLIRVPTSRLVPPFPYAKSLPPLVWRGAGAVERGGLENRCPPCGGPRVRIPPSPPLSFLTMNSVCWRFNLYHIWNRHLEHRCRAARQQREH